MKIELTRAEVVNGVASWAQAMRGLRFKGKTLAKLAVNRSVLGKIVQEYELARKTLIESVSQETELVEGTPEHELFAKGITEYLSEKIEVHIHPIDFGDSEVSGEFMSHLWFLLLEE